MQNALKITAILGGAVVAGFGIGQYFPPQGPQETVQSQAQPQVIYQNPNLDTIMTSSLKFKLHQSDISTSSSESYLSIKDTSTEKAGWLMWVFNNVDAASQHTIRLNLQKSTPLEEWAQVRIRYVIGKTPARQFFYLIKPATGKIRASIHAKPEMASVQDADGNLNFTFPSHAPDQKSTMYVMLLPAAAKREATASLDVKSIEVLAR